MKTIADVLNDVMATTLRVKRYLGKQNSIFTVPQDVTNIWVTGTGGGGGGNMDPYFNNGWSASGGGAGCYIYRQGISVNPLEQLTIYVADGGKGGTNTTEATPGQDSYIIREPTNEFLFIATGGKNSFWSNNGTTPGSAGFNQIVNNPKISTSGIEGISIANNSNAWGQGGANPMGRSTMIPCYNYTFSAGYDVTSSGFGFGGGGMYQNYTYLGTVGNGGEGALIIEYFSSL